MLGALSAVAATAFLCLSARADVSEEPLVNPADETDVWGKKITGLGDSGDETALVFTKTGATMNWTLPDGVKSIWYLVVGGGGSGGMVAGNGNTGGGGGGAGGLLTGTVVLGDGRQLEILVGKGGDGVTQSAANSSKTIGETGGDSGLRLVGMEKIVAKGGGGGGSGHNGKGAAGGSGGGSISGKSYAGGAGTDGQGFAGGGGYSGTSAGGGGGGGGAGGSGGQPTSNKGGDGGPGVESDILGEPKTFAGGGGGGARSKNTDDYRGVGGVGGGGNGGRGGSIPGKDASYYGGGGGGTYNAGNTTTQYYSGAGYQGVVIVRYRVMAANEVMVPEISGKTYNGELQRADVSDGEGYTVTKNDGGVEVGEYDVVLTLASGYQWVGGSTAPVSLTFTIAKAENAWNTEPSLSKTAWELADDPATVSAGAALSGTEVLVTYDEGDTVMPLSVGAHRAIFMVTESQNYLELAKTVDYTISKNTNVWTVEPSLTKTTWAFDEEPGEIVAGEAKFGEMGVTYDNDSEIVELPTTLGAHSVKFVVAEGDTYTALSKTVNYTVAKKINSWTTPPVVTSFNIEDPVPTFVTPEAAHGTVVTYYDGNPEITELPTTLGTHSVTYVVDEDDDYGEFAKTYTFQVVYKPVVDQADPSKVFGYRIPKLGANQDEVALVFTNTGYSAANPMNYTLPQEVTTVSYLVVGGGAAGGMSGNAYGAGGGGAGGVVESSDVEIASPGISVSVGAGGAAITSVGAKDGNPGVASTLALDDSVVRVLPGAGGSKGNANGLGGASTYACGGGAGGYNSANQYTGGKGAISNGGDAKSAIGGGGGGAGGDGGAAVNAGGPGGVGVGTMIFGDAEIRIAGGGSGSPLTRINGPSTDGGGMGAFKDTNYGGPNATSGTSWGAGGGGAHGNACLAGSGHQGVVVVRYVEPEGVVMVPYIAPKTYTGETLVADVPANVGYTVTENAGGTDVGEYAVVLTLNEGYHWDGGSTSPEYLAFAIAPARNEWMVEPSITKATWLTTDGPGVLTAGATKFGTPTATIAKDYGDAESFSGTLPTAAGQYVITYAVETSDNWIDPEVTEKSVGFEIVSGDVVPPFAVTKGETKTVAGEGRVDLSVGYAVHCEVESDKTVDIYAYIAEDGTDTTNEVKIAEGMALDATGTGVIPDLKPGMTYWVALGGKGGDTIAPTTEFTVVTVAGPATGLAASATFTNDPKEFVVTGSVTPGLGTTTVYLRWSLNSDALDNLATYTFAYGEAGTFVKRVQYVDTTDTLTWDVAVSNSFASTTHGDRKWDAALPVSTRTRTDTVATTYTWTGAGENNDWENPENWSADRAESFGYPNNATYAKAKITRTVTINLGGKTFAVVKGEALVLDANSGDVVTLTNGTLKAEYFGDGDFGAAGTTVIFRDATLNRARLNPKDRMTAIFEGNAKLTGMVRPWNSTDAKIIFRNGDITIGGNFGNGGAKSGTEVIISNATVTVQGQATGSWGPGTFPVKLQNGPDRQARIVHAESHGFDFVQSPYTLAIPEQTYATPYLQAVKPLAVISSSPTFNIDVTNWKHARRVPILTFTDSASGAAATQYGSATVRAYENGVDVTAKRNARLEWNAARRTLYYRQNGQFGMMIHVR